MPERLAPEALGRVLCVAPHPDDETLGCGGTLAAAAAAGAEVSVVLLSAGEREPGPPGQNPDDLAAQRRSEFGQALQALGVTRSEFLHGRDTEIEADTKRLSKALADILERERPDTVLVPSPSDPHRDHSAAAVITAKAVLHAGLRLSLLAYEVWAPVTADRVVEISAVLPAKRAALDCYAARFRRGNLDAAILALNLYRAQAALLLPGSYAEAFAVLKPNRI